MLQGCDIGIHAFLFRCQVLLKNLKITQGADPVQTREQNSKQFPSNACWTGMKTCVPIGCRKEPNIEPWFEEELQTPSYSALVEAILMWSFFQASISATLKNLWVTQTFHCYHRSSGPLVPSSTLPKRSWVNVSLLKKSHGNFSHRILGKNQKNNSTGKQQDPFIPSEALHTKGMIPPQKTQDLIPWCKRVVSVGGFCANVP